MCGDPQVDIPACQPFIIHSIHDDVVTEDDEDREEDVDNDEDGEDNSNDDGGDDDGDVTGAGG